MYLHIAPKLRLSKKSGALCSAKLLSVEVPELNAIFKNNVEIVARKPFPNKLYLVACKKGITKKDGFLIEVDNNLKNYTVISKWERDDGEILSHILEVEILGQGSCDKVVTTRLIKVMYKQNHIEKYIPEWAKELSPLESDPIMTIDDEDSLMSLNITHDINHFGKISSIKHKCSYYPIPLDIFNQDELYNCTPKVHEALIQND